MYYYGQSTNNVINRPDDLQQYLPLRRRHHYREGRSMAAAARCWMASRGRLPREVAEAIGGDAPLDAAHFEYGKIVWGGGRSDTDLMVFLDDRVIAIEAKVDEALGPTVAQWIEDPKGNRHNRERAIERYARTLSRDVSDLLPLRYQLLHRALSAARTARATRRRSAWMIVQAFPIHGETYDDITHQRFKQFVSVVGTAPVFDGVDVKAEYVRSPRLH